ncbi:polyhydroxyalkanoate synthesis repressor PhaR [Salinimonas lutimaris]|uniref:polyhydroxyalkanoate synthesis repressor PhaR n=1 Tax=Salinimonas lutimaris TaxID=914153 RepID=UPI0010C016AF|nr:polyhydroxyalkanoate synthesis repressor PhaR [Salinimonas lutimaris]
MITIKKYPNRRLYDTAQSQYVNLDYIKQLIEQREEFTVIDSKTKDDITKTILLQIISESETSDGQSLLTNSLLKQLIRFYDTDMQLYVRQYLEQSLLQFIEQQDKMQGVMQNMMDSNPFSMFSKMMEKNMDMWKSSGDPKKPKE